MRLKQKIWLLLGAAVAIILLVDLGIGYQRIRSEMRAETEADARMVYGFMMATRRIYQQQFVASGLPVNDKTIGFLPAHSFSRIAKDFANWNDSGVLFNNVSDQPRNPANRADRDELAALEWFRENPRAVERLDSIVDARGMGYLLYTAPIWVEGFCLKCHGARENAPPSIRDSYAEAYGYREGDLRGVVSVKIPTAKFDARFRAVWGAQAAKSLIGYALLFVVIGLLIDRLVTRRLVRLQAGAERIASGDYATRLKPTEQDEICAVARSFNRMAEAIQNDIAARQTAEAEIQRLAYYDPLTNLPNRSLLMDRLALALAVAQRQQRSGALIVFNLDRFKNLNDVHGHEQGDLLLIAVGGRLAGLLREGDTLARVAADEFAILLQDLGVQREQASRRVLAIVGKIHADMLRPYRFGDEETVLTASLGVTLIPDNIGDSVQDVLRRADTALHRAKAAGGNQTAFFEGDMGLAAQQRYRIERELRQAIPAGELRLYLQPQVDAAGLRVGAEVLVRWQHPEQGLMPPGMFIAVAEESDLIVDLGAWVLSESCRLLARETMAGKPLKLSINISPRQFRQRGFVPWVKDLLAATGADPTQLTLEVTEGLVIEGIDNVVAKMSELAALGIRFSIDDFGTGYSSLSYLKRMPIHELKIDKSFVQDAPRDPNDGALVETILSVARHLHLQVVAEGVETEEQFAFLSRHGTVIFQGYLFGKPAPAEDWLARWQACDDRGTPS
jgi:diguanylate cyclase (GGDEF)-like protein